MEDKDKAEAKEEKDVAQEAESGNPASGDVEAETATASVESAESAEAAQPAETAQAAEQPEAAAAAESEQAPESAEEPEAEQAASEEKAFDDTFLDQDLSEVEEIDKEEMWKIYEDSFRNVVEGQVVTGRILEITPDEVLVDVGYKSEGVIPIEEFRNVLREGSLKVGDEVDVYLERTEDSDGRVELSKEKADKIKIWDEISRVYENGEVIEGRVISKIKGGFTVDIGVRAFLPGSQIDIRPVRDPESIIGRKLEMKVIKLNKRRGNIVLSRRVILEEQREALKRETLSKLKKGALIKGTVKNITEYGAFIDLGGIDGLLHITDMSWGRVNHPSELFQIGDEVEVLVLKFDPETERVSLGLKQKTPDPWETADVMFPVGSRVKGKVISLTDYGAFVELVEGIEGLVHVSEMSWTRRVRHPSKIVAIGDEIEAVVLDLDKENKRISLGMKQAEPNPWDRIEEKYPVGCKVRGRVRNLTNFGAFVELEEGIDGLIHISDMSWTRRINHPSEVLKKGEEVEAMVMEIDPQNERLSLSLKHATPNPWDEVTSTFRIGADVTGRVVRITDFGVFVELEKGIEGLVHISELDKRRISKPEEVCQVGDELTMRVIKIDPEERRIGLSVRRYLEAAEQEMTDMYMHHESAPPRSTVGDMIDRTILRRIKTSQGSNDNSEEDA
jgi:small subunit ribosomal protein S1